MHTLALHLSEKEFQQKFDKLEKEFPILHGEYRQNKAIVSLEQVGANGQRLIFGAADGADFYQPKEMSGHADRFVFVKPDPAAFKMLGTAFDLFTSTVTPVSKVYGEKFAADLVRTDQILTELAIENLAPEARETFQKNPTLLREEAGRVRMAKFENAAEEVTPISSVSEGFHTFHQLVAELTMAELPGAKTGEEALHGIVFEGASRAGLTTEITRLFPLAVVGPSAHSGRYFPDPLVRNSDGKIEIAEHVKQTLSRYRDKAEPYRKGRRVCPMAGMFAGNMPPTDKMSAQEKLDAHKAGLQLVAEAYWHVFQMVSKQSAAKLSASTL
jgi:hypothetical protein